MKKILFHLMLFVGMGTVAYASSSNHSTGTGQLTSAPAASVSGLSASPALMPLSLDAADQAHSSVASQPVAPVAQPAAKTLSAKEVVQTIKTARKEIKAGLKEKVKQLKPASIPILWFIIACVGIALIIGLAFWIIDTARLFLGVFALTVAIILTVLVLLRVIEFGRFNA
jgi:hypothetical protein